MCTQHLCCRAEKHLDANKIQITVIQPSSGFFVQFKEIALIFGGQIEPEMYVPGQAVSVSLSPSTMSTRPHVGLLKENNHPNVSCV